MNNNVNVTFLLLDHILKIHTDQIRRYGGAHGIRDLEALKSAVNTPAATYNQRFLHTTIEEMAAAYLFHIVKNHPFLDGNKRTGVVAALTFLIINGNSLIATNEDLVTITLLVAQGKLSKSELAVHIQKWIK